MMRCFGLIRLDRTRALVVSFVAGAALAVACSSSSPPAGPGGGMPEAGPPDGADLDASDGGDGNDGAVINGTPATFNVLDYTPPAGVLMWSYGTVWLTQLTTEQQSQIGADLAVKITYIAQCDNYDRLGGIFFIKKPKGQMPATTDPRTEIVRFITPFSDYTEGTYATHVYPNASVAPYAETLADTSEDVWIGIAGGSNPYSGDPCVALDAGADFSQVGFKYSVDFVSTKPLVLAPSTVLTAVSNLSETATPITGTLTNPGSTPLEGHITVIISGHGSGAGGDEYEHTEDTLTVNDAGVGTFSTEINCASYAKYSPDGNPGIFEDNTTSANPRNWCPGAPVASHTYAVTLMPGDNAVSLAVNPPAVPSGSYYATSINFTSP